MSKLVEEWKPIEGYEDFYQVSDWGRVRSIDRIIKSLDNREMLYKGKILSCGKTLEGYDQVLLCKYGRKIKLVHRLVAEAFIPNPDNKPEVDHIKPVSDGGTNEVWNLKWATAKENANNPNSSTKRFRKLTEETKKKMSESHKGKHYPKLSEAKKGKSNPKLSEALKGRKNKCCWKKVQQYSKNGDFLKEWNNISNAGKECNICSSDISACCKGKLKTAGGYIWKYAST